MRTSNEIYNIGYEAQYKKKNPLAANAIYNKLIELYPDSKEAGYAKSQIQNIKVDVEKLSPTIETCDDYAQIAEAVANGTSVAIVPLLVTSEERDYLDAKARMQLMMLSTGYSFDGYRITTYHDVVFEELIIGIGIKTGMKAIGDIFNGILGEEYTAVSERLKEVKLMLKERTISQAANLGANALIGVDFESSMCGGSAFMVSMTATAVTIERLNALLTED